MANLPAGKLLWRILGGADDSWVEVSGSTTFSPPDGANVEVKTVAPSKSATIFADTIVGVGVITAKAIPFTSVVNTNLSAAFTGTNLVYSLENAPSWLAINPSTGVLSGTAPSLASLTLVTVTAKNSKYSASASFYIDVVVATAPSTILNFTSALPSGFTFTGSGANATYWNASGKLVAGVANAPRYASRPHHVPQGAWARPRIALEGARTNKHTNRNYNPTDLTGVNLISGSAVLSRVSDATALAAAGLDVICSTSMVYLIDNSAGADISTVEIDAATGDVVANSCSVYARSDAAFGGGLNLPGASAQSLIPSVGYSRVTLDNVIPSSTSAKVQLIVPIGRKVWFILNQLEAGAHSSSVILVAGGTSSRAADRLSCLTSALGAQYNQPSGGLVVIASFDTSVATQLVAIFSNSSTSNNIGLRVPSGNSIKQLVTAGGIQNTAETLTKVNPNITCFNSALSWDSNSIITHTIGRRNLVPAPVSIPSVALTRLDIGCLYNGGSPMFGYVDSVVLFNSKPSYSDVAQYLVPPNAKGKNGDGQSLEDNHRTSNPTGNNTGELASIAVMDAVWSANKGSNFVIHGATGGSAAIKSNSTGGSWWFDPLTGQWGDAWYTWLDGTKQFIYGGGVVTCIDSDHGQQDAGANFENGQAYIDDWVAVKKMIFAEQRKYVGNVPIIIYPTVGRTDVEGKAYQLLREAQWRLAQEVPNCFLGPETFDLEKGDAVHLSDAGYTISGTRRARKMMRVLGETISGNVDGPTCGVSVRSGATIDVPILHEAGGAANDFTPSSAIVGFRYFKADGSNVPLTALRVNGGLIRITLSQAVAGTLYYGYDTLLAEAGNYANLVHDNSPQAMPLRAYKQSVA